MSDGTTMRLIPRDIHDFVTLSSAMQAGKAAYAASIAELGKTDISGSVWITIPGTTRNRALLSALALSKKGAHVGDNVIVGVDDMGCSNQEAMCHEEAACAAFLMTIRRAGFKGWLHSEITENVVDVPVVDVDADGNDADGDPTDLYASQEAVDAGLMVNRQVLARYPNGSTRYANKALITPDGMRHFKAELDSGTL